MLTRSDGRRLDQLRPLVISPDCSIYAEGSALIECGSTRVVCTASVEDRVPPFRRGTGSGWVTSEYGMLPRSTSSRMTRESSRGRPSGRTQEIQRIIGRALRSVVDLDALGERTIWVDCDVLQADGGTRTASITGAFVALALATQRMRADELIGRSPLLDYVAAVSVGVVGDAVMLDLAYDEDSTAEVDMNVVMTGSGAFVEVQGTAEGIPFKRSRLDAMLDLAAQGVGILVEAQREVLGRRFGDPSVVLREGPLAVPSRDDE
jgi:ribonuclease PH